MDADAYLDRLGLSRADVTRDVEGLRRLQRAHVRTVPFETLAITGHPHRDDAGFGAGVTLTREALSEKVVERGRGGFCYELNGVAHDLLAALGFDVARHAACVVGADGSVGTPANHHTNVVTLDRRYVVDVGTGVPTMRRPLPLDGEPRTDETGLTWRLVDCDRPDADYRSQYRRAGEDWTTRYVLADQPRELSYFRASCDYLSTAPESEFTGDPVVSVATPEGHLKLGPATLTTYEAGAERERAVAPDEYDAVLAERFGIRPGGPTGDTD